MSRRNSPRRKNRSLFSSINPFSRRVDRALEYKRSGLGYSRALRMEPLEERRLLAIVTVTNNTDASNGDTSSIAALMASDGGDGISLREALIATNNTANAPAGTPDEIHFNIPGGGVQTIQPTSQLPTIAEALIINGYTQPGAAVNTAIAQTLNTTLTIELNGQLAGGGSSGLRISSTGGGSTIRGLSINQFSGHGIFVDGSDSNTIAGNMIGLTAAGNASGNGEDGIRISGDSDFNTIGGVIAADRNMISRNSDDGIDLRDAEASNNLIQGNNIGTTLVNGLNAGNDGEGVVISGGANNNTIGGTEPGAVNFIGFNDDGVVVEGATSINNRIQRNSMFINDDLGIDLGDNGISNNDAGDGDSGPNRVQNFPVIIGTPTLVGNSLSLDYRVDTALANATYPLTIEFFSSESFAVTPDGAGRRFIAQDVYEVADAQTVKSIVLPLVNSLFSTVIVATATDAAGNTSEFSLPVQLALPTILGSEPTLIRNNETIGADETNIYQYIAHSTGKLHVRIDFLHEFEGDLDLEIRDQFGNLLAPTAMSSSPDNDFEEIIIPVVSQQKYFIRVIAVDLMGEDLSSYSLEVENFPAPVPTGVHLDPASDTGMMNNDNVTSDTTPTFFIQTDVLNFADTNTNGTFQDPDTFTINLEDKIDVLTAAQAQALLAGTPAVADEDGGIAVEVTLVNTTTGMSVTGFADPVIGVLPEVYRFTVPVGTPLAPGVYLVSARTKVWDGQKDAMGEPDQAMARSNASPPLWLTISADLPTGGSFDLLSSSDTGMFNDDNVTNKMSPAFSGQGPANNKVYVYAQPFNAAGVAVGEPLLVGNGVVGSDATDGITGNSLGRWEVTVEPMADGKYGFFARFESAAGILGNPVAMGANFSFVGGPVAIPNTGPPLDSTIVVPAGMATIADLNVSVSIEHPIDAELDIFLIAPNGTEIELSTDNGNGNANYTNTIFDDAAGINITAGAAPFTGTFRPEENLAQLNGLPIAGTWTLRVTDDTPGGGEFPAAGQLLNWSLQFQSPLMVVIDTVEPNTPHLDLLDDTGRSNVDNITNDNTPMVSMTTTDPNVAFSQLLFTDNFKFRIYDRYQNSAQEVLIYDSALDTAADNVMTPNDMFTALTQLTRTLPVLTPANPAITAGGQLADGVHNLKLEVEDRAGNISHDFLLSITVDTVVPPVSFGLPGVADDGLLGSSDTGVILDTPTLDDRITADATPTFWGLAEANSVVRLYVDLDDDGEIDAADPFIGQTVAIPYDGNHAFADGYWEITSNIDLDNPLLIGLEDGLRQLLVTAEDVAGNVNETDDNIGDAEQMLDIFLDTRGPQVQDVFLTDFPTYDLFDPKPSTNGFTPLVDRITVKFTDLPPRLQEFLYPAVNEGLATTIGNYQLTGDHVGNIFIKQILFNDLTQPGGGGGVGGGGDGFPAGTAPVGSGGVIIDGGDRDDHGSSQPGADTMLGTADDINVDGWQFIEQMVAYAAANSQNAGTGILAIGASSTALSAIQSVATVLGIPLTVATTGGAVDLATVNFSNFAIVYVPSDESNTGGGVSSTDLNTLTARKLDIQNYVNSGGSLVALTEAGYATPYSWLELPDTFTIGNPSTDTQYQTQALIDAGLVITNAELINGTPLHNTFTGPVGFNGLQPFVYNVGANGTAEAGGGDDEIITLGLGQGGFIGGMVMTEVILVLDEYLPDDRYTLTIRDSIRDDAGNELDGESQAGSPFESSTQGNVVFPSGDGEPGGDFVARFTIDSRPEIGTFIPTTIAIDINGNFVWDPANAQIGNDRTNVDLTFTMDRPDLANGGFATHDTVFAGKFTTIDLNVNGNGIPAGGDPVPVTQRFFDQLGVYGFSIETGEHRWLIDFNSDGVSDLYRTQPSLGNFNVAGALPVAGNFNNDATDGDEIGLYNAGRWAFDTNRNFVIEASEVVTTSGIAGLPIVGDFDGDGRDDLGVFNNNFFTFDLAFDGFNGVDDQFQWGFSGVLERPVAADMDQDGIDDIGLFVPRNTTQPLRQTAEWYFLISGQGNNGLPAGNGGGGSVGTLKHAFNPVPFGNDLYAEFGDELALPIIGNFDPPVTHQESDPNTTVVLTGDYDGSGKVDNGDYAMWKQQFGQTGSNLTADGNHDGRVDSADYSMWRDHIGMSVQNVLSSTALVGDYDDSGTVDQGDYSTWKQQFGQTGNNLSADGNSDGRIDSADYALWRDNLGASDSASSTASGSSAASFAAPVAGLVASAPATIDEALLVPESDDADPSRALTAASVDAFFTDPDSNLLLLSDRGSLSEEDESTEFELFEVESSVAIDYDGFELL